MKLEIKNVIFTSVALCATLASCSDIELPDETPDVSAREASYLANDSARMASKVAFAEILSKAVYDSKAVREFLKAQALRKFDKNYDVLYLAVKNEQVAGATFRQLLVSYSSEEEIERIEDNVPLLNIYLTSVDFLGLNPDDLDVEDPFVPVAAETSDSVRFFSCGEQAFALKKGEIPTCHTFVVGENSRVVLDPGTNKSLNSRGFLFKDPIFDGSETDCNKSTILPSDYVGQRALDAYAHFYADDNGVHQKGLQRDYIYYGLTPQKTQGVLLKGVSEYLAYVKVNPNAIYRMCDQEKEDPKIVNMEPVKRGAMFTDEQLAHFIWSKGALDLRFDVITSNSSEPIVLYVPLLPTQLWNVGYTYNKRHKTLFRHTKYNYFIKIEKFTPKDVYLDTPISMGKWDLASEALCRIVKVSEDDLGEQTTKVSTYEVEEAEKKNIDGSVKLNLGIDSASVKVDHTVNIGNTSSSSNTVKKNVTVTEVRTLGADDLGSARVFFYDPVIESVNGDDVVLHTYSTGIVEFGIIVK